MYQRDESEIQQPQINAEEFDRDLADYVASKLPSDVQVTIMPDKGDDMARLELLYGQLHGLQQRRVFVCARIRVIGRASAIEDQIERVRGFFGI